jgi:hypothetical protein
MRRVCIVARVGIRQAAEHFGVSVDTIRRRIGAGELTASRKTPGDDRSPWLVEIPDEHPLGETEATIGTPPSAEVERMAHVIEVLESQLEARTREISELHQLLAARMLPARVGTDGADTPQDGATAEQTPTQAAHRRPWWRFWRR